MKKSPLKFLLAFLFGCSHSRTSFPITRRVHGRALPPYIVCLDCGKEMPYDWNTMRVLTSRKEQPVKQGKFRAEIEL